MSSFPTKNSQEQLFFQPKSSKNLISNVMSYDAENSYMKGVKNEEDLGRKSTNRLRGEMPMNPKSPENQKQKKSFVHLRAVTPQEKISDQNRQEKRRLSHAMPRENIFGSSYKINDRLQVDDNLDVDLKKLPKKLNFIDEFLTDGIDCRFIPNEEDIYNFHGTQGEYNELCDMYEENMNVMASDFVSRDLNTFELSNYQETLDFPSFN